MPVRKLWSIAALLLSSVTLLAQGQTERPSQFRTGVELIQLDVVVLDGKRQPVPGLTEADFTVLDNGSPTPIRAFTPIQLATRTRSTEAVWATEAPPDVATNQIGEQEGRLVIILMDRTIPAERPTVTAKKIATAAIESLGPNDLGAVVSTANNAVQNERVQNLTSDRARLLRAINSADPATSWSPEAEIIMGKNDPLSDGRCLCGLCVLETITRVADAVQNMPRRTKLLFFIGSDMVWQATGTVASAGANTGCEMRLKDARAAMFRAVDRANLRIHSVDPQGLVNLGPQTTGGARGGFDRPTNNGPTERLAQQQRALTDSQTSRQRLDVLPARTGGRTVVGQNNPELTVADIYHETDTYYVLGIERAASAGADGTRSIEVKVARKGVTVHAQRQYGPSPAAGAAPSTTDAGAAPAGALGGLLPRADLPLSLAVTAFANPDSAKPIVRINVDAGAFAHTDGSATPLDIAVLAVDRAGKPVASVRQTSTVSAPRDASGAPREVSVLSQIDLEPGDYGVRVAVTDPASGKAASVFTDTTVPKFDGTALSVSGVSVEMPKGPSGPVVPTTKRTFARTDQVRAVTQIYQGTQRADPIVPVSMRVQILDAKGTAVRDQSLPFAETAFTNRRADCVITLPLANLPAGEYLLKLEASTSRAASGRALRFIVR
jgi:VWFA-related protein